jgi:hypothetical protein
MKEAVGGTWLFGIVITFIVFFTTYISMSTNYAKSFKVKDEILITIEHYKGVNEESIQRINSYLDEIGYFSKGRCDGVDANITEARKNFSKWLGFNYNSISVGSSSKANYCIRRSKFSSGDNDSGHPRSAHYQVVVFFSVDWPIVGALFNIRIEGETSIIHMNSDSDRYVFS